MSELDEKLREHYGAERLPDERVARLLAAAGSERGFAPRRRPQWFAAAAALVLLLAAAGLWVRPTADVARKAAAEVARSHLRGSPPEIEADRFARLEAALTRLDFALAPSQPETLPSGLVLIGGRYCSVLGEPAAQILLIDGEGRRCTLFVARSDGTRLAGVRPGEIVADGVRVRLWHDHGRLFAMAL